MQPQKVILLACGSFNPPTYMHLRMFEIARDHLHRMGAHVVVGGLVSPVHDAYGKSELIDSYHRTAMLKLALENTDWIKLSDWETKQETWTRTRPTLMYHQNHIDAIMNDKNMNETWNHVQNGGGNETVRVKLLCGADLLESFGTPGLWSDEDIESIVGHHGLVVITREHTNPLKFIYNSDVLTKYMSNIVIVTEWIRNEVSSTRIRRALRRNESVRYLIPDKVLEYIQNNGLYGTSNNKTKYLSPYLDNSVFLTPSPTDISMESPSPTSATIRCLNLCNNNLFNSIPIDEPDKAPFVKHPGQAVKVTSSTVTLAKRGTKEVGDPRHSKETSALCCGTDVRRQEQTRAHILSDTRWPVSRASVKLTTLKNSKSYTDLGGASTSANRQSNESLDCKSCDENLIKFIFTKHGIQVISDVETIV